MPYRSKGSRIAAGLALLALAAAGMTGCSAGGGSGKVTITLSGPNQFTNDTKTFGPAWDKLVAAFEKDNPNIELKTNVLPLSSWATTSAAQLTAGTAPELIFGQTPHKPDQISPLTADLQKANPFADDKSPWIDAFKGEYFGGPDKLGTNADGDYEAVPFNLVAVGLYFNKDALKKANVSLDDLKTFDGFLKSCPALRKAGYAPVGLDNSGLYTGWTSIAIGSMIMDEPANAANQFAADGSAGTATPLTPKSVAHALLTGEVDMTKQGQFADSLKLLKKFFDECGTENFSGVSSQGAFSGGTDFTGGTAAMAWGTNFSSSALEDASFDWGTIPFPTLSTSDSQYANGNDAQFGVNNGGTAYMIPAYIKGDKRAAAVKFLQYVSSPKIKDWLDGTGSISALTAVDNPGKLAALAEGEWSKMPLIGQSNGFFQTPAALAGQNEFEGYLIGSNDLNSALTTIQKNAVDWAKETASNSKWTEDWATK